MLTYGQVQASNENLHLLQTLQCHPFSVALAAATVSTYQSFYQVNGSTATETYSKLLNESLSAGHSPFQSALKLYVEVAITDVRMRHTFDLLGSLDVSNPVPAMLVTQHLRNSFYNIPEESLVEIPHKRFSTENTYWDSIKSVKNYFLPPNPPVNETDVRDDIFFLRHCPLFSFMSYLKGFEFIRVHDMSANNLRRVFFESTCEQFDDDYCRAKQKDFQQNTWLVKYRSFNKEDCLASYYRSLPGLSSPGVITACQYSSASYTFSEVAHGTVVPKNLSYSQYVHIVSHYHRVFSSLEYVFLDVAGDISAWVLQNLMNPHFEVLQNYPHLAQSDRLATQILAADGHVALLLPQELESYLPCYKSLVDEQKKMLGSQSLTAVSSQIKYADMLLCLSRSSEACTVLQGVLSIYKKLSPHLRDQMSMDVGHSMSALGRTYAQLRDYNQSREWFEHALGAYQTLPEQGKATKKQQRLISSSLIDVAHSYLVLGDLAVAKKYSDLACMVLDSLYPEGNGETVRILRIGSVIHSLMGDKEESMKQQARASKIESKL